MQRRCFLKKHYKKNKGNWRSFFTRVHPIEIFSGNR
jgi:hypothetical protein